MTLRQYYKERGLDPKDSCVIQNGTDRESFFPIKDIEVRGREEPLRIITHHWSSNIAKGFKIYDKLDGFCKRRPQIANFTFLGNSPDSLLVSCNKIAPKPYREIPPYLQSKDLYVTATQFESGGCHIVEGMSCGLLPMVRKGGGGTEEYSKGYGFMYSDFQELEDHIRRLYEDYDLFLEMRDNIRDNYTYGSREMCKEYMKVFCDE